MLTRPGPFRPFFQQLPPPSAQAAAGSWRGAALSEASPRAPRRAAAGRGPPPRGTCEPAAFCGFALVSIKRL